MGDSHEFGVRGGAVNFVMDGTDRFEIKAAAAQRAIRNNAQLFGLNARVIKAPSAPE